MKNFLFVSFLTFSSLSACVFDPPTPSVFSPDAPAAIIEPADASLEDAGLIDASIVDASVFDAGNGDARSLDAALADARMADAGQTCTPTTATTWYRDNDRDTYGAIATMILACTPPNGYVNRPGDCDDNNALRHPGQQEVCNRVDDNCNTMVDEGCTFNACGGLQALLHVPGQPCGTCNTGRWACNGAEMVRCDGDRGMPALNACGGCNILPQQVGGACGRCGLNEYVCNGMTAVTCNGDTLCPLAHTCSNNTVCASANCNRGYCTPEDFRYVPPGTFMMGSPSSEPGHEGQETLHTVQITRGFFVQRTETTQLQWRTVIGNSPSQAPSCPDCPVNRVNWFESVYYLNRLSVAEGLQPCYQLNGCTGMPGAGCPGRTCETEYICQTVVSVGTSCTGYRLPTEGEWEYLARAGTTTAFSHGPAFDPRYAWCCGNGGTGSHPVALLLPNPWDLSDVHGNVQEWTGDWWAVLPSVGEVDPNGPSTGAERVTRGGSWSSASDAARSAFRSSIQPTVGTDTTGFRRVRTMFP